MLNRRQFIIATGAAVGSLALLSRPRGWAAGATATDEKSIKRPNILFLLADQWRGSATGYAGDPNALTPNLDRLARQSLDFRNTVSVCPVCTPYRAALLTGRYPTSTGMFLNDAALPVSERGLGEALKDAGYATGYIGKWHIDGHGRDAYIPPERRHGWDYWKAAECDHAYNHSHYYTGTSDEKKYWEGYDAFAQTKDAQQYIQQHAKAGNPFALVVSFGPPHFPEGLVPAEYHDLFAQRKLQLPPNVPEVSPALEQFARDYYANCTAIDKCVGDLLATLEQAGLAENTIVVFTSDHGEMLGSHGVKQTTKQVPWDESARVPLLLRWPQGAGTGARTIQTPLTTVDILPTLLGLAGLAIPASVEGEDLSAMVRGGRETDRAALYMGVSPFGKDGDMRPYRAIRTSQYTYVRSLEGPWLMFDDLKDPHQMNNLVGKPEFAALQKELDGRLAAILKKNGDAFLPAKESLELWGYALEPGQSVRYGTAGNKVQSPKRK